jgi:hypothetical protein
VKRYEFDHSTRFSFYAHLSIYLRLAGWVWVMSVVLALVSAHLHLYEAVEFALAAITALGFNVWVTWCYEMYLHSKYPLNPPPMSSGTQYIGPSNYTDYRHALTVALGLSTMILFGAGLVGMVAAMLARSR